MFEVVRGWIDKYLSDEEAVLFILLVILSFVIVITLGSILAPVLTGIILAFLMQGMISSLGGRKVPNVLAFSITFLMFLGGAFAVFFFVIPLVWRQMANLFNELPNMIERGQSLLVLLPANYPNLISEEQVKNWVEIFGGEAAQLGQWIVSFSISKLPVLVSIVVYLLLVPILVFFFLKDKDQLLDWFKSFLPKQRPLMNKIGSEMNLQMANYVRGKAVEILVAGGVTYMFFKVLGLNYAALLGFLVGVSVIIPYIGFIVVTLPVTMIAYFQWGLSSEFLYVMIGYLAIQAVDAFVIVPWLFSEALNLHPIAIITAVLVFGSLWGLWGVFFAIPLATLIKAIMNAWPDPPDASMDSSE